MRKFQAISALAVAVSAGWALPAQAQVANSAAVLEELKAMRAKMEAMAQRIDSLESELAQANAKVEVASQSAQAASATAISAKETVQKAIPVKVDWKGAPKFSNDKGWSFKPRGRIQLDVGGIDAPSGLSRNANASLGTSTELRRAWLGVEGTMPGGLGYRFEADLTNSSLALADAYISYKANRNLTFVLGNQRPFTGLEDMTAVLNTTFMERSAFSQAFGFERRIGLAANYKTKDVLVEAGVFSDDTASLSTDTNRNWSVNGRVVFMPKLGNGSLHLGASAQYHDFAGSVASTRYRTRPFLHATSVRFVDTGTIAATGERRYGVEAAYMTGPFHAVAEGNMIRAARPGMSDPTFKGGYAEVGYVITGEKAPYKDGVFDRLRPAKGIDAGGIGAIQVNLRYDHLDLNDAEIVGGRQETAGVSVVWAATNYLRFVANYGHLWLRDAAITADGDDRYGVDAMGMRAQIDF